MKKKIMASIVAIMSVITITACGGTESESDILKWNPDKYITSIGDYKNLQLEAELETVTDDEIEEAIEGLRQNSTYLEEVTGRELQMGDTANIDFVGKMDGVAFDGGTGEGYDLGIGSNSFIPGFEDALVGMKTGETRDIDVTFPEDYQNEELAGKPAVFTVTLNAVKEEKIPELDDEFAKNTGFEGVATVEELKVFAREQLELYAQEEYENQIYSSAMSKLIDICEFTEELPQERYKYYYESIINNDSSLAAQYGVDIETFTTIYYGMETYDDYLKYVEDTASDSVKIDLITSKILKLEKQKITDKIAKKEIEDNLDKYGCQSYEDFIAQYDLEDFKSYLVNQRALDIVKENASIVAPVEVEDVNAAE